MLLCILKGAKRYYETSEKIRQDRTIIERKANGDLYITKLSSVSDSDTKRAEYSRKAAEYFNKSLAITKAKFTHESPHTQRLEIKLVDIAKNSASISRNSF